MFPFDSFYYALLLLHGLLADGGWSPKVQVVATVCIYVGWEISVVCCVINRGFETLYGFHLECLIYGLLCVCDVCPYSIRVDVGKRKPTTKRYVLSPPLQQLCTENSCLYTFANDLQSPPPYIFLKRLTLSQWVLFIRSSRVEQSKWTLRPIV